MRRLFCTTLSLASLLIACSSSADVDPKSLYRLDTEGSTKALKVGETGKVILAVRPQNDGHVKPETPFKLKLQGTPQLALTRTELTYKDHARVEAGPIFEIPFTATSAGAGEIAAELTFFVCTKQACLRTTEQLRLPVEVR